KNFAHIARQMMPSVDGNVITIKPGTTKVIIEPITIDPEWNADQLFIIAWIQDDATKEVLQAGTSQGKIHVENDNVQYTVVESQGNTSKWDLALSPTASGHFKFKVETDLPAGWDATVTLDGTTFNQAEVDIPLSATVNADLGVNIISSASSDKKGVGTVHLTISGPRGTEIRRSFKLYSKDLEVLLLRRDERDPDIPPLYERTLGNGDYVYALIDPTDESMFSWNNYVVLMEVGQWALTLKDIALLRAKIDAGNTRIYLIGAEIGYGLADPSNTDLTTPRDVDFMENYLHATYVKDANSSATVVGVTDDPIGNGLNFSIKTGIQNQDTPDEIAPRVGAISSFYYGASETQVAGIRYSDSRNRLVYLGFGAEGIGNDADRTLLLNKGIEWLNGSDRTSAVGSERSEEGSFLQNISFNHRDGRLTVDLNLNKPSTVSLQLFDVNGRSVSAERSTEYSEGLHRAYLNVEELASGTYYVGVTANGLRQTKVIVITR
ncbi:MAG: T9SS type A sorting domain-containing protein, partial [Candidatus Kapaibacterium sp.]